MRAHELLHQRVQRLEPAGILYQTARLVIWGIHGANDFITALRIHDTVLERRPPDPLRGLPLERIDELRERAARDVVPTLPPDALRDSKGAAVGHFIYSGLPEDHCRAKALEEGAR